LANQQEGTCKGGGKALRRPVPNSADAATATAASAAATADKAATAAPSAPPTIKSPSVPDTHGTLLVQASYFIIFTSDKFAP